ncbi:hypothetical protein [Aestuariivirga sp.]|uniref:hypothetical protein n=1 Tax=Aestuariivirga sp. TaxID=2650926 RepID=UPI0039E3F6C0
MAVNTHELREMVRDILKEVVPSKAQSAAGVERVSLLTDADLATFVRRVLEQQDAIRAGRLRFTLAGSASPAPAALQAARSGTELRGVITETIIDRHAGGGTLVLAADAVITPLARDRARKLGLKLERRR